MSDVDDEILMWNDVPIRSRKPKLVILDDDECMYRLCRVAFQAFFEVAWSPSKRNFLDSVTALSWWAPDVVITDIHSPGMTGLAFLRETRKRGLQKLFPVIVWTGASGCRNEALALGAAGCIAKPCKLIELRACVGLAHYRRSGKLLPMANRASRSGPLVRPRLVALDHQEGPVNCYRAIFKRDYDVTWIPDKSEFLDQVKRAPGQAPDVVISNLLSPPMTGMQFLEALWQNRLHSLFPVVVISTSGRWATAVEYGAIDYLRKPFTVDRIREVVNRAYFRVRGPWA